MSETFDVIYADPPWRYGNMTPSASPENHYPTMAIEDICALDVPAANNAVLYLWATAPLLQPGQRTPSGQRCWRTSVKHLASSNSAERLTRSPCVRARSPAAAQTSMTWNGGTIARAAGPRRARVVTPSP